MRTLRWLRHGNEWQRRLRRENLNLKPKRRPDYLPVAFVADLYRKLTAGALRERVFGDTRKPGYSFVPRRFDIVKFDPLIVSDEGLAVVAVEEISGALSPNSRNWGEWLRLYGFAYARRSQCSRPGLLRQRNAKPASSPLSPRLHELVV